MNILDILIALPLIWGVYRGFTKGFINEICSLFALILGIAGGLKLVQVASIHLQKLDIINSELLPFAAFLIVFTLITCTIFIISKIVDKLIKLTPLSFVNKLGGAAFGFLKYCFLISMLLWLFNQISLIPPESKVNSVLYKYADPFGPKIIETLSHVIPPFDNLLNSMEVLFEEVTEKEIIV